jgi:adenine deaminase
MTSANCYEGQIVDIVKRTIYPGRIVCKDGFIVAIERIRNSSGPYLFPGFVDAHIHIESSMLLPSAFSEVAKNFGTVACVCDPHEIANVAGVKGINYLIENSRNQFVDFVFGAPSCVPATNFETSGAKIDSAIIKDLFDNSAISFLAEVMNFPGVIDRSKEVIDKIKIAQSLNKPIDGHAPGLVGSKLQNYIDAGISTDHECVSIEEAEEKITRGMKILIREGSAAKNFENLYTLIDKYPSQVMLCSDDLHPDDLIKGHLNLLVRRAIEKGCDLFNILQTASLNAKHHYGLKNSLLQEGDAAKFFISNDLKRFSSFQIIGDNDGKTKLSNTDESFFSIKINFLQSGDIQFITSRPEIPVIKVFDHSLYTARESYKISLTGKQFESDIEHDVLKIVVVNRYQNVKPAVAFVHGFGLKKGAIASSVAHDSHNIIAVGVSDNDIISAINSIIQAGGGLAVSNNEDKNILQLEIAGLISNKNVISVAGKYADLNKKAEDWGCPLTAPFMTLSFMALLVIPELKISDKGLFDVNSFSFVDW